MKTSLKIILATFIVSNSYASTNWHTDTISVFTNLFPTYTFQKFENNEIRFESIYQNVSIKLSELSSQNAYVHFEDQNFATIVIDQELAKNFRNRDELAFVIAHEMAHVLNRDYPLPDLRKYTFSERQMKRIEEAREASEIRADLFAKNLLRQRSYNLEKALALLSRINATKSALYQH